MNNLQIFNNAQFGEIRTIDENGTVLFCGSDIAKALGYSNTKDALARHCKEDGVVFHDLIDNMGREQHAKFINEGNVYRLITHSKLPAAEQFESWVFDEVLPTIRRNGAYMTDDTLEYSRTKYASRKTLRRSDLTLSSSALTMCFMIRKQSRYTRRIPTATLKLMMRACKAAMRVI